jgi:hypothetical protein
MSTPSSSNVLVGRGIPLFAPRVGGVLQGYRDLGNCDVFSLTPGVEFAELLNYRSGVSSIYKRVAKKTTLELKIAGYEFDSSIISLMLYGEESTLTQSSATVTAETLVAASIAAAAAGLNFQTSKRNISGVVVKQGATTFTAGTDYEVLDAKSGTIHVFATATIAAGTAVTVDYTAAAIVSGDKVKVVSPGKATAVEGRMLFLPNPAAGQEIEHQYWNASIAADGEQSYIADEFAKWSASVSLQDDSAGLYGGSASFPFGKIIQRTAA